MAEDIITLEQLLVVPETRLLTDAEFKQIELEKLQFLQRESVAGRLYWYEIEWCNRSHGSSGLITLFRPVGVTLTRKDYDSLTQLQESISGTNFELYCYTGANAQAHLDEIGMYESLFADNSDVVSLEFPVDGSFVSIPNYRLDSFVTTWTVT